MDDSSARATLTVDFVPVVDNGPRPSVPSLDELRAGDETAYDKLVTVFSPWMQRVARQHAQNAGLAEDIVQETWLAVLSGLDTFQGRSSLKTWIFQILVNQAKCVGRRERRVVAVDPFDLCSDRPRAWAGWPFAGTAASPARPEDLVIADEAARTILAAVAMLPPRDARIIALRDIQGLSAPEAAEQLGISNGNQRVVLHRARARLRAMLRSYVEDQSGRETSGRIRPADSSASFRRSETPPRSRSPDPSSRAKRDRQQPCEPAKETCPTSLASSYGKLL